MKRMLSIMSVVAIVNLAQGQGLGRGALTTESSGAGLGRGTLPDTHYEGYSLGGTWGLKPSLGWANVNWDIGSASGSESVFAPQLSLFYKATDNLDMNFSTLFISAEDSDGDLGKNEADLTRLALGIRYWFNTQTRITPYFGGGLGYYLLDGKTDKTREDGQVAPVTVTAVDVKDAPGAFLEGGVAFQVTDNFFVNLDLTYDFLLGSADATINGKDDKFKVQALALNLGVTWMF